MHIKEHLSFHAARQAEKIALVDKGRSYTYVDLFQRALKLAEAIRGQNFDPSKPVALAFEPSMEGLVSAYACLALNLIFVPVSSGDAIKNIVAIFDKIRPELLLTTEQSYNQIPLNGTNTIFVEKSFNNLLEHNSKHIDPVGTSDLAAIIFTSGSSGNAKGVMVVRDSWNEMVETWERDLCISQYEQYLNLSGFNVSGFFDDSYLAFIGGGTAHICEDKIKRNMDTLMPYIVDNNIRYFDFTPAYTRQLKRYLQRNPSEKLPSGSLLVIGSESWFVSDMLALAQALPDTEIMNSYGLTEASIDSGIFYANEINPNTMEPDEVVPIGRPFGDTEFVILNDDGSEVHEGQEGELCISSQHLAKGYWGEDTPKNFDYYQGRRIVKTGDLVWRDEQGYIRMSGRKDQVVKIHGKRIDIKKLEQIFFELDNIEDVVILFENKNGIKKLLCFVCPTGNISSLKLTEILFEKAKEVTLLDSIPLQVVFTEKIPRRADGKLLMRNLRELVQEESFFHEKGEKADSFMEIFQHFLGDSFNKEVDIFLQGADSLMVEEICLEIEKRFGISIPTTVFYGERTATRILNYISNSKHEAELEQKGTVEQLEGDVPLSTSFSSIQFTREYFPEKPPRGIPNPVLLTGATGFLGIHLLNELTKQSDRVYCLVRGESPEAGMRRLQANWSMYIKTSFPIQRITVVPGDFSKSNFQLSQKEMDNLLESVGAVIHSGYWVNFLLPYEMLRATNVQGLENLLAFSSQKRIKPFSFVSSSSASLISSQDLVSDYDGYELTKYVGEKKIQQYGALGYPTVTVSPGMITPSVENSTFSKKDFFWSFVQTGIRTGTFPDVNWSVDLTPVDFLASQICSNTEYTGKKIIYANKEMMTVGDLASIVHSTLGVRIVISPLGKWIESMKQQSAAGSHPLTPFLSEIERKREKFFASGSKHFLGDSLIVCPEESSSQLFASYLRAQRDI